MRIGTAKKGMILLVFMLAVLSTNLFARQIPEGLPPSADARLAAAAFGRLPLNFEMNMGQTDRQVHFSARGRGYTLFLTSSGAVLSLVSESRPPEVFRWQLGGADPSAPVEALEELPGMASYFIGSDPSAWRRNIPTYGKVRYENVYPGVDLIYYGNQSSIEYDFVVKPGGDAGTIRLAFDGPDNMQIAGNGDLVLHAGETEVRLRKPDIYQDVDGVRRSIRGNYTRIPGKNSKSFEVGFGLDAYDVTKPLIIDPVLDYSSYLGGLGDDGSRGIALDGSGYIYVTGSTSNVADFPGPATQGGKAKKVNPLVPDSISNAFSYVVKLDPKNGALLYSAYFNGTARSIAVSPSGKVHVAGQAGGPDFPFTPNAYSTAIGGADAFVLTLSPDMNGMPLLNYATYLGGSLDDAASGIFVRGAGNVVEVTGTTYSDAGKFTLKNAVQNQLAGGVADGINRDAFVARLDTSQLKPGDTLIYATYLGGTGSDDGYAVSGFIDAETVVTGQTCSTFNGGPFPTTAKAFQSKDHGGCDAFLAIVTFDNGIAKLSYSTYVGGGGWDLARGIVKTPSGFAITGETTSIDFPTTNSKELPGTKDAYQAKHGEGLYDVFVIVLSPGNNAQPCTIPQMNGLQYSNCADLSYSTFLGGKGEDYGYALAGKPEGINFDFGIYVTGKTCPSLNAADAPFPQVDNLEKDTINHKNDGTGCDAFVTRFDSSGKLVYSTYLGGSLDDIGLGIAVDVFGTAWVTGATVSGNFPPGVQTAIQPNYGGGAHDAFVAKVAKKCVNEGGAYAYLLPFVVDTSSDCIVGVIPEANVFDHLIAVSPDGARVFVIDGAKDLYAIELDSTGKKATKVTKKPVIGLAGLDNQGIALSPDGKKLYVIDHHDGAPNYLVIDTDTLSIQNITFAPNTNAVGGGVVVHPDGKRLFVASYHGHKVLIFDTTNNTLSKSIEIGASGFDGPFGIAVTPDGHWLYVVNRAAMDKSVSVVDVSTPGMESWTGKNIISAGFPQTIAITPKKISPYNEYLAYTDEAVIYTDNTGNSTKTMGKVSGNFAAFTPDGNKVYFAQGEGTPVYEVATDKLIDTVVRPGSFSTPLFGSFIGPQDRDADGINDQIDTKSQSSDDFEDTADKTQFGAILDRKGGIVKVWPAFPKGFWARAYGGNQDATINGCNKPWALTQGGAAQFICGSLTLKVTAGQAKVGIGPDLFARIGAGGSVKVSDVSGDASQVDNLGTTTITLVNSLDQAVGSIPPGQSFTTPKEPQVTCTSIGPFTYDAQPHAVTCSATASGGSVVSGSWSYSYSPSAASGPVNAGTYTLNATFTSSDPQYTNAKVTLAVTIGKAPLTITAADVSKLLGAPNPAFTATYSGFVPGEDSKLLTGTLTVTTPVTDSSPVGSYPIAPGGLTSANYAITFVRGTLSVTYNVCILYEPTRPVRSGAAIPIKVQLCSANGTNQSSLSIAVTAQRVSNVASNVSSPPNNVGNANADQNFRFEGSGYIYNLKTDGLAAGTYNLLFAVTNDPLIHAAPFQVR
jgi:DNA-binding beta-propeller fold protein YncE